MSGRRSAGAPVRKAAIVAKLGSPDAVQIATTLASWLEGERIAAAFDAATAAALGRRAGFALPDLPRDVDLAVVAGGDGTLLSVARATAPLDIPILGINLGSLGFLTELQPAEALAGLERVVRGGYTIEERQTLRVRHEKRDGPAGEWALLNDVVVTKSALARMIAIRVRVDGEDVATYTSDGLIVATPTGSTAYNLSAGGPIVDPRVAAFVISPICPHTMTYRPVVVPGDVRIDVTLESPAEEVYLTLDGQIGLEFTEGERVAIDRHPHPVRLVRLSGMGYFEILRRKLRWGER